MNINNNIEIIQHLQAERQNVKDIKSLTKNIELEKEIVDSNALIKKSSEIILSGENVDSKLNNYKELLNKHINKNKDQIMFLMQLKKPITIFSEIKSKEFDKSKFVLIDKLITINAKLTVFNMELELKVSNYINTNKKLQEKRSEITINNGELKFTPINTLQQNIQTENKVNKLSRTLSGNSVFSPAATEDPTQQLNWDDIL